VAAAIIAYIAIAIAPTIPAMAPTPIIRATDRLVRGICWTALAAMVVLLPTSRPARLTSHALDARKSRSVIETTDSSDAGHDLPQSRRRRNQMHPRVRVGLGIECSVGASGHTT
jgi:hypothetical protein